jgi:hypothetical protein
MRGWSILIGTFLVGVVVGFAVANRGPALIAPYVPKLSSGPGEHIEGQVVRKQREGNRLLVKINTAQGPMLVTFTQKVADLDVLLDPGDTVTLMIPGYATFVEDPVFERIRAPGPAKAPA